MAHDFLSPAKVTGAIAAVFGALATDPFGLVSAIGMTVWSQAGPLFTVTSIGAFTLADQFPALPQGLLKWLAILFGVIFVLTILDNVADHFLDRIN